MARKTKADALKTKQKLLSAAQWVFSRQGIAHAKLEDIAKKAGVTRGALYWHFVDKQDIVDTLSEQLELPIDKIVQRLEDDFNQSPIETIRQQIRNLFTNLKDNSQLKSLLALAYHQGDYTKQANQIKQKQKTSRLGSVDKIARELEWAKALDQINSDTNCYAAALGIHALIDGLLYHWSIAPNEFNVNQALQAVDQYLDGINH